MGGAEVTWTTGGFPARLHRGETQLPRQPDRPPPPSALLLIQLPPQRSVLGHLEAQSGSPGGEGKRDPRRHADPGPVEGQRLAPQFAPNRPPAHGERAGSRTRRAEATAEKEELVEELEEHAQETAAVLEVRCVELAEQLKEMAEEPRLSSQLPTGRPRSWSASPSSMRPSGSARVFAMGESNGPSLLEHLDKMPMVDCKINAPLMMPVSEKYKDMGTIVVGKIESGHMRKGDTLLLMPNKNLAP
ncbi:hypothetical protein OH77DRAFT_1518730 [Trametes cingulata]|nr:hypothetical protein OH77DRAFT_1518730 [Trametes cingulata]